VPRRVPYCRPVTGSVHPHRRNTGPSPAMAALDTHTCSPVLALDQGLGDERHPHAAGKRTAGAPCQIRRSVRARRALPRTLTSVAQRYGALTGSAGRACRYRARASIRAWHRNLRMCRARSAGHPTSRISSRATGSAATAGTASSCDAVRHAPGSAMSTACRDFTRRGRAPGAGSTTKASARTRTRLPQARPS
jgi:hypothetical protein